MNLYAFSGRLTKDAEKRFTQAGKAICNFTVAVDVGYGEHKSTNFIRCSLFGKRAEGGLVQYLVKGQQVAITGELKINEYDDRDGNKRTSVDVSVGSLDLVGGKSQGQQSNPGNQSDPFAGGDGFGAPDEDIPFAPLKSSHAF